MLSSKRVLIALAAIAMSVSLGAISLSDPEHEARVKATGSCAGCDLRGASLQGLRADGGDLSNADFSNAVLYMATFKEANLAGASFAGADLSGAILTGALDANLSDAITDSKTTCPNGAQGPCQ